MQEIEPTRGHGGARENSGREPKPGGRTKSFFLARDVHEAIDAEVYRRNANRAPGAPKVTATLVVEELVRAGLLG